MPNFQHVLIIENPQSTNAINSRRYVKAVQEVCPGATFTKIPFDGLKTKLPLDPLTLICISGGDGTVNAVAQSLLGQAALTEYQRKTPILPLWCGNANDIAHMINGRASTTKCKAIVTEGNVVPVFPLRCELLRPGRTKPTVRLALGYLSFGVSAQTAERLNRPSFRQNPLHAVPGVKPTHEVLSLFRAMYAAPSFTIEQNGEEKRIYDWIVAKGPRMARSVKLPIRLTERAYYQSIVRKSIPEVAGRLNGMAWGLLKPEPSTEPIAFTTRQQIWAQFDGEPLQLAMGTKVTVSLNPQPIFALSKNLA